MVFIQRTWTRYRKTGEYKICNMIENPVNLKIFGKITSKYTEILNLIHQNWSTKKYYSLTLSIVILIWKLSKLISTPKVTFW